MLLNLFGRTSFLRFLLDGFCLARTAPRLLALVFCVGCGTSLGMISWRWAGEPRAGIALLPILGILCVAFVLWAFQLGHLRLFYPFPVCRRGKCRTHRVYTWDVRTIYGRVGWGCYVYRCNCGDHYFRRGKRFMEILPPEPSLESSEYSGDIAITEANTRPYKKLTGFRQWGDDHDLVGRDTAGRGNRDSRL